MFDANAQRARVCCALLILGGCGGPGEVVEETAGPSWLAGLPRRAVSAAPGETVWAVVPRQGSEAAEVATYRLEAVSGDEAVLSDGLGRRFERVPGALVHAVSGLAEGGLATGAVVLGDRWDARKIVGRVAGIDGGQVRVAFDWNGTTATGVLDSVVPLPAGAQSLALRWVAYRGAPDAAWHKGLCFAESDERVWISDEGAFAAVVPRDAARALDGLGRFEGAEGAAVAAYSWGRGYRPGVIQEVLEPGLRYAVRHEDGRTRAYFFEDLTAPL